MDPATHLTKHLKQKLQSIMRSHELAKFGDALVNFLYSVVITDVSGTPTGARVLDKALAEAIRKAGLRTLLPSSISAGEIGDGAEALLGYCYLEGLYSLDEMINIMKKDYNKEPQSITHKKGQKEQMTRVFTVLLLEAVEKMAKKLA